MAQIVFVLVGWVAVSVVVSLLVGRSLARCSTPAPAHAATVPHARPAALSSTVAATVPASRFATVAPIVEAKGHRALTDVGSP